MVEDIGGVSVNETSPISYYIGINHNRCVELKKYCYFCSVLIPGRIIPPPKNETL